MYLRIIDSGVRIAGFRARSITSSESINRVLLERQRDQCLVVCSERAKAQLLTDLLHF